jgi:hypothetical protein
MILEKNNTNVNFLGGKYKAQSVKHPTAGTMTVVQKDHYDAAAKIATEALMGKHAAQNGIRISCHAGQNVMATDTGAAMCEVAWRTLHPAVPALDGHVHLTGAQLKQTLTGGPGGGPSASAAAIVTPAALAEHVRTKLNLAAPV